jgi:hypothetical protein
VTPSSAHVATVVAHRALIVAAVVVGLVLTFMRSDVGSALHPLVFFTVQSNAILAAVMLLALLRPRWSGTRSGAVVVGAATLWISVTGIVYHTLLTGPFAMSGSTANPMTADSILLHTVTPLLAAVGWLTIDRSQRTLPWRWAALWLIYPLAYLAFALLRGLSTHDYPYPFVDVNDLGYGGVTLMSLVLCVAFWALGLAVIALGRLGVRLRERRPTTA